MLIFALLVSLIYPIIILWPSIYFPMDLSNMAYIVGQYLGLVAYLMLFFQYIGSTKLKFLERILPFDIRIKNHRLLGYISCIAILFHPSTLLIFYYINEIPFEVNVYSFLGSISALIVFLLALSSFFNKKLKLKYELWKKIHWLSFPVFIFVYIHAINIGSSMYGVHKNIFIVILFLYSLLVIYKILFEIYKYISTYTVSEVIRENDSVVTLKVKSERKFKSGQFGFINIMSQGKWLSWHPFTISAPSDSGYVTFTIKKLGDFTSKVQEIKEGDKIKLDYPYGGFTTDISENRVVFIAGGVGITPFHSIVSSLYKEKSSKKLTLIYSVNYQNEFLFRKEFEEIFEKRPDWNLKLIVSMEESWKGIKGWVTPDRLKGMCNNTLDGTFYLCGPKVMVSPLKGYLKSNNVSKKNIRFEEFLFLP